MLTLITDVYGEGVFVDMEKYIIINIDKKVLQKNTIRRIVLDGKGRQLTDADFLSGCPMALPFTITLPIITQPMSL